MSRESILTEVSAERDRQDGMFGGATHDDTHTATDWVSILVRHLGLAVDDGSPAGVCLMNDHVAGADPKRYRRQMVRVAAIAVAAVEVWDRKSAEVAFSPAGAQSRQDAPEAAAEVVGQPQGQPTPTHYERMAQGVADQYGETALLLLNARSELEGHERGIEVVLASQASSAELKAAGERKFHPKNANGKGGGQ